jgi:hypothetical protein
MATAARALMDELRRGYDRIKAQLKEARHTAQERTRSPESARSAQPTIQMHTQSRGPSA